MLQEWHQQIALITILSFCLSTFNFWFYFLTSILSNALPRANIKKGRHQKLEFVQSLSYEPWKNL